MSDYTPTTEEIRNTDSGQLWTPTTQYVVERYADDWQGGTTPERVAQFDRWLAEVKAQRDKHIISLIKKDCEHAKFGDPCFHDYIIDEIEAELNRQGEEQ